MFWFLVIVAGAAIAGVGIVGPGLRLWRSVRALLSELGGLADDLDRTVQRLGPAEGETEASYPG